MGKLTVTNLDESLLATQEQAELGESNETLMTPQRTQQALATHTSKCASDAHGPIRTEYVLHSGMITTGSVDLTMPEGITSLTDFDEIIIIGTMSLNNSSTWRHFTEVMKLVPEVSIHSFSINHEVLFEGTNTNKFWLRGTIDKSTNRLSITYNRSKIGEADGTNGEENAIGAIFGVIYN